jgi:hypothetical protein
MNIFPSLITRLRSVISKVIDPRQGANIQYSREDLLISPFACFFSQDGSFLQFQKRMEEEINRSNMGTLFGVKKIPSDDQIRNFVDLIKPDIFNEVFFDILNMAKDQNLLSDMTVLGHYNVIALDGCEYFNSKNIQCDHCLTRCHKNGVVEKYHSVLGASLVSYRNDTVFSLSPEHITNDGTNNKQDCEQKAIFRWFDKNFCSLSRIIPAENLLFLADDLHSHEPLVSLLNDYNVAFILNCKPNSHKTLYEFTKYNDLEEIRYLDKVKGFKDEKVHIISWLSGLPLRDYEESNNVNLFSLKILNARKVKIPVEDKNTTSKKKKNQFKIEYVDQEFSFITNIPIDKNNVKELVDIGRSRWKIENNNFHVLKHRGYKINHNFGHGKKYLSSTLITLNILAYLFHTMIYLTDEKWRKIYDRINHRINFFKKLVNTLGLFIFYTFDELIDFICQSRPPPDPDHHKTIKLLIERVSELEDQLFILNNNS